MLKYVIHVYEYLEKIFKSIPSQSQKEVSL